ncbi:hypothetical protein EBZU44_32580 [Enterobacter cloacae]|nr:hypothetical protein EBZU44_32580 [Enterobacter cloacae]
MDGDNVIIIEITDAIKRTITFFLTINEWIDMPKDYHVQPIINSYFI